MDVRLFCGYCISVILPIKLNILVILVIIVYFCDQNLKIVYLRELSLVFFISYNTVSYIGNYVFILKIY